MEVGVRVDRRRLTAGRDTVLAVIGAAVVIAVGAVGCASSIAGTPAAPPTTATTSSGTGASTDAVRWMDRFCGSANFLVDAASVDAPPMPADPDEARKVLSDQLGRLSGVLGTALIDFDWLIDNSVEDGELVVGLIYDDVANAKTRLDVAKSMLDTATELTPELLGDVNTEIAKGLGPLEKAVTKIGLLDLPDELEVAAESAPNCNRRSDPSAPTTTA